jgi:methionyl aminopeptidase
VVCHGIPSDKRLKDGDIINIDVTVIKDGWHGDTSRMYIVGKPSVQAQRLVDVTCEAMWRGIRAVQAGVRTSATSAMPIQQYAEASASRRPRVLRPRHRPDLPRRPAGPALRRTRHRPRTARRHDLHHRADDQRRQARVRLLPDGWTVVTKDHSLSAQWEHTVAVTADGVEILTRLPGDDNDL